MYKNTIFFTRIIKIEKKIVFLLLKMATQYIDTILPIWIGRKVPTRKSLEFFVMNVAFFPL